MSKASSFTKALRLRYWVLRIVDLLIMFSPVIIYFFVAMSDGSVTTTRKIGLVSCVVIALIMSLLNIILQKKIRSIIWVIIIGLYITAINILPLIIILAVSSILEEFVLMPLIVNTREQLNSSKVIDRRLKKDGRIK